MPTKPNYSNAFSRVLNKSKSDTGEKDVTQVKQSTNQLVNSKDLYEVYNNQRQSSDEADTLIENEAKKAPKKSKETRTVKGFKLTTKTQKIIGLMAQLQGKKEYEILEQGVDLLLEAYPEMKKLLKML